MNVRRKRSARSIYMYAMLICMTELLGLYTYIPGLRYYYFIDVIYITAFITALITGVFQMVKRKKLRVVSPMLKQGGILLGIVVIELIASYLRYKQPFQLVMKEGFYYFVPVFAFFVFMQFDDKGSSENYLDMIVKVSILSSIIAIIAYLLFTYSGTDILNLTIMGERYRNGTVRFELGGVVLIAGVIISATRLLARRRSRLDIINLALGAIQIIYINKTRSIMLYLVVAFGLAVLTQKKVNRLLKTLIIIVMIIAMFFAVVSIDTVSSSVSSFVSSDAGIMMRFRAITFYINQFLSHPILGMGFISSNRDYTTYALLGGYEGRFYRSDVGAIGLINEFGIVGGLWAISFFILLFRLIKNRNDSASASVRNILYYLLISIVNLSFMDTQRFMHLFLLYSLVFIIQSENGSALSKINDSLGN